MSKLTFDKTDIPWQLRQGSQRLSEAIDRLFSRFQGPNLDAPGLPPTIDPRILEGLFWLLVVLIIGGLIWRLRHRFTRLWSTMQSPTMATSQPATIEVTLSAAEWVKRARTARSSGQYAEACRGLYFAMLQRLHDTQQISPQASRTDGEYAQILLAQGRSSAHQTIIQAHEHITYGNQTATIELLSACEQAYQQIDEN